MAAGPRFRWVVATGNLAGFAAICDSFGERDDVCRLPRAQAGIELAAMDADRWNASYKDERIKAIVAIDPGLHYGLDASNVTSLVGRCPAHRIGYGCRPAPGNRFRPSRQPLLGPAAPRSQPDSGTGPATSTAFRICKPEGAAILRAEGGRPRLRRSGGSGPRCGSPSDPAGDF